MLTDPESSNSSDIVQAALERIQARISERRAAGEYPHGLEDELDRHYRQVSDALHGTSAELRTAALAVQRVAISGMFAAERINNASRVPAGTALHRVIGKATLRQTQGVLQQLQEFADATRDALEACLAALQDQAGHTHPQLERRLAYLVDKLPDMESLADGLSDLEVRVTALESILGTSSG